ncbi:interleukin-1 receptor-associated kinase 4 [Vigna unguiculata]|uniref:non-specific serine/threonine protein kinase n=1 Tax=Vigna unguiculata TaxID=3917 RepID=A0A4D6NIB6_VIGUN|nr:interleukin-1 receptor-associated kinase 4 [Vigna unguiculata]
MFLKCVGFNRSKHTSSSKRKYPTIIEELCRQFSLADLRKSTNNFNDRHKICYRRGCSLRGGVYKGSLEHNGVNDYAVALKRICGTQNQRVIEFKKEIELLCQLHHPNLISLIGFYEGQNERILVYEYMSNGSLDRNLERGELSWKKRVEICIGAARGLHYLHAGAKRTIIHRNIKPSNILLDANMEPKLADFSLSVQGQPFMSEPKPIKVKYVAAVKTKRLQ